MLYFTLHTPSQIEKIVPLLYFPDNKIAQKYLYYTAFTLHYTLFTVHIFSDNQIAP